MTKNQKVIRNFAWLRYEFFPDPRSHRVQARLTPLKPIIGH